MESCGGSFKLDQIYDARHPGGEGGHKLGDKIYDSVASVTTSAGETRPEPHYVAAHSGNVTAILGKTAILNCRVTGVGNR